MSTVTLWLLIASAYGYQGSNGGVSTLARFATVDECERVRATVARLSGYVKAQCVQATVIKESHG